MPMLASDLRVSDKWAPISAPGLRISAKRKPIVAGILACPLFPFFIQTFPTGPQSSDKNPAPLAEHLNPLTENQFFT